MPERTLLDRLRTYVGGDTPGARLDENYLQECADEATELVNDACGIVPDPADPEADPLNPHAVPAVILGRAALAVASELFHQQKAPSGITQFATPDGSSPARIARDPMVAARPMLAPYLPLGFA